MTKSPHIVLRGLISSSIGGNVGDSMVDDMRLALEQAREDETRARSCFGSRFSGR